MTSLPDEDIRAALLRITASEPFRNAPQLVSFLNFIVERTLTGQQHAIKGYTIATQALGRPAHFDPQADPIVRVEAGRLRRALDAYYAGSGRDDPVKIVVPRGTYVPQFVGAKSPPDEPSEPAAPDLAPVPDKPDAPEPRAGFPAAPPPTSGPSGSRGRRHRTWIMAGSVAIGVLGLAALALPILSRVATGWLVENLHLRQIAASSADEIEGRPVVGVGRLELNGAIQEGFSPDVMRSMIIDGLARYDYLVVVDLANAQPLRERERYVLNLRVAANSRGGSVVSRLTHEPTGKVIWTRSFDLVAAQADPSLSRESMIARQIAPAIARPYSALFADLRTRPTLGTGLRCVLQAYDYWTDPTVEAHARVRSCLEAVVAAQPNAAKALANLAYIYLDEFRVGFNARPHPLDRALLAARRAVEIAPESPRTNQALMAALFFTGETEQALNLGRRALDLNPLDTDILAEIGARLIQLGRYDEGRAMIARASALNPADPPWYSFFLFLAAYMQGDIGTARAAATRIRAPNYVLGLIAKSAIAAHDKEADKGRELVDRIVAVQPEFGVDPAAALARRNFAPEIQARLLDALRRAGLGA